MVTTSKKVILITGGNSGIGKAAAIQLAALGHQVIIGCRNLERAQKALSEIKALSKNETVVLIQVDLSSKDSIDAAAKMFTEQFDRLDVLIHNAADFNITQKVRKESIDGIETIWATNHLGPVRLTNALLDSLKASPQGRIISISSKGLIAHPFMKVDMLDPEFKERKFSVSRAYYQSKLAQEMYTIWLTGQLKKTNITANCIRVTNVKIDMDRYPNVSSFMKFMYRFKSRFSISPEQMAETYVFLSVDESLASISGKCFDEKNRMIKTGSYGTNMENIEAVMELTRQY